MPAYMYSYIKQGRSVSSLRFHIVHVHDILSTNTYFVSSSRSDISWYRQAPNRSLRPEDFPPSHALPSPLRQVQKGSDDQQFEFWINHAVDHQEWHGDHDHNIDPHYLRCLAFRLEVSAARVWGPSWTTFKQSHLDPGFRPFDHKTIFQSISFHNCDKKSFQYLDI